MKYNLLEPSMEPASGERLFLKTTADARPVLVSERPPKKEVAVIHEAALQAQKHVVQTRETLYSIAKKYDVKQEQIREWNRLTSDDLKVGQELIIYKN
jgi:LysM repeat protein